MGYADLPRAGRYLTLLLVGIVVQSAIEWVAVGRLGLWGYAASHPTLP